MSDGKNESLGALWIHESQSGQKYMSGTIEIDGVKHGIVVFKNKFKEENKHPDYRILPKQEKQDKPAATQDDDDGVPF